jgi:hypothetical protein
VLPFSWVQPVLAIHDQVVHVVFFPFFVTSHLRVQAVEAQYVVDAPEMCFMPESQVTLSHVCCFAQHAVAVVPSTPFFAGSMIWLSPQVIGAPPHLVASASQQTPSSVVAHGFFAQYNLSAPAFLFLPAPHV